MDNYSKLSKEELLSKIKELNLFLEILKKEKNEEELLNFPWVGNLGHWHWNVKSDSLLCNDWKILALNYTKEEIPDHIGFEFFTSKLHPDDYERVMNNMRHHLVGKTNVYEVQYRIKTKDGKWKWYYDRGVVSKTDDENHPILVSGIVFDITNAKKMELLIKEQNEQLKELVDFDCLTRILNRRGLLKKLEYEIKQANNTDQSLSVVMMDIDKFKAVNDTHGHLIGDKILEETANTIKMNLLGKDIVGRYGGEEFLIILPNTDKENAYIVADRIRESIDSRTFTNDIKITISGGVKEYNNQSINKLIDEADIGLYLAKESGRNKIICE